MKEDRQNPENKEEIPLDSIPFPDDKKHAGNCSGEADNDGAHECKCKERGGECEKGEAGCKCEDAEGGESKPDSDLMARLDEIAKENIVLRDMLARTSADFDNFRKRTVREKEEARKSANADFALAMIPVLDALALALEAARKHHPEASVVLDGIDMISSRFKVALKSQGVEEIVPQAGADFDTAVHESISHQKSDAVAEGKICAVARMGFTINGKLLRPASVIISGDEAV